MLGEWHATLADCTPHWAIQWLPFLCGAGEGDTHTSVHTCMHKQAHTHIELNPVQVWANGAKIDVHKEALLTNS